MAALSPNRKRAALAIVLVGSVLIGHRVMSLAAADDEIVAPVARPNARSTDGGGAGAVVSDRADLVLRTERLDARQQALASQQVSVPQPQPSLFGSGSWRPPASAAAPPVPPPPPRAPSFPYTYVGGLLDNDVRTAFFEKSERVVALKTGDTVDGVYRVDQMNDKQMQLTYLPLSQRLTVPLGGAK